MYYNIEVRTSFGIIFSIRNCSVCGGGIGYQVAPFLRKRGEVSFHWSSY
jgi:hypothetical protein